MPLISRHSTNMLPQALRVAVTKINGIRLYFCLSCSEFEVLFSESNTKHKKSNWLIKCSSVNRNNKLNYLFVDPYSVSFKSSKAVYAYCTCTCVCGLYYFEYSLLYTSQEVWYCDRLEINQNKIIHCFVKESSLIYNNIEFILFTDIRNWHKL